MSAGKVAGEAFRCRQSFSVEKAKLNFFPGHMNRGMQKMQAQLSRVDCFLEIHDARIPFSGRNPNFYTKLTAIRPHILVFNKMDLVNRDEREEIREIIMDNEPHLSDVIWTNANTQFPPSVKSIMSIATEAIERNAYHAVKPERHFMMIGVPNTGKSAMINALRRTFVRKANIKGKVEPHAGATRSVQERIKLLDKPLTYIFDTPGISTPSVGEVEGTMRLAACGCLKDADIGLDVIVDYLLYYFNKRGMFEYVPLFELEEPTDNVYDLLLGIAKRSGLTHRIRDPTSMIGKRRLRYNTFQAAEVFLKHYRKGDLGRFILDDDKLAEERAKRSRLRLSAGGLPPLQIDSL